MRASSNSRGRATPIFARRRRNQAGVPTRDTLASVKTISDILAAWVGVAALLAGGIFGVQQYLAKEKGDRVKETLNFLDRYHQEPFVTARLTIYQTWEKHTEKVNSFWRGQTLDDKGLSTFIKETIRNDNLASSVDLVTDFYSALEVCITARACDEDLALLLFHADASAHFNRHFPYIEAARRDQLDLRIGKRLEDFKKRKTSD